MTYLEDGHCSLSNNLSENAIRPFTVGRRNWLFSTSPKGATASSMVYTMVEMAKANDLNTYKYLAYLLAQRPNTDMSDEQFEQLASSQEQCMQALLRFRKFIKSNHVNSLLSKFVSIKQEGNCGSYFITDEDGKIIFKSERVHRNSSVQTSINNTISSIYKNIDENIDVCSENYQRGRFYEESNSDNNFMCEHI